MIRSYCGKCKRESAGDTCESCGRRATAAFLRDVWSISAMPLADGRIWLSILYALIAVVALMLAFVFGLEALLSGNVKAEQLWAGPLTTYIFCILPLGLMAAFLFLLWQGKEVVVFILDKSGAHLQTWHEPSLIKSWARLQSADHTRDIPQPDGTVMHLSQERHMLWQDVQAVKYRQMQGVIYLYHTPHCAPMVLRMPEGEYDNAAAFVGKYCKNK